MKKSSKILIVILTAMLLVGVLALAIFANGGDSANAIKGKFVVASVGYETWEEAVAAADNTHTIYLNENITLEEGIVVSGAGTKVRINLNGKTVTVADPATIATAFNAQHSSELTITGSGEINNVKNCFGAAGGSIVTVEGTGKDGITINHAKTAAGADVICAFRIHDRAILNLSGLITVNGKSGTRNVVHMGSGSGTQGAAALNISNAKIHVPLLTEGYVAGTGNGATEYSKLIVLNDNIDVNIIDSDLSVQYGTLIYASGASGSVDVTAYKNGNDWNSGAATGIKLADPTIRFTASNTRFSSDYSGYSKTFSASGHNPGASLLGIYAKMDAKFDSCIFYTDFRAVTADSNSTITTKKLNQHQLYFKDCHFFDAPGNNSAAPFFVYGVNYKIEGGSFSVPGAIGNGSHYYLALVDGEGNPTGKWAGGYINNVFLNSSRSFVYEGVSGNWTDSTYAEPDSAKTHDISLLIDGAMRKFIAGYFSDNDLYNSYFPEDSGSNPGSPSGPVSDPVWDNVISYSDLNGIKYTGDYIKDGANAATGTLPFGATVYSVGTAKGVVSTVLTGKGNGYLKHYWDGKTFTGSTASNQYVEIKTPGSANGNMVETDKYVFEWDISTDNGAYTKTTFSLQGRQRQPRFDASGKYLGYSNAGLQISALDYSPKVDIHLNGNSLSFADKTYTLPLESGVWTRITFIVDPDTSSTLEEITIPAYAKNGNVNTSNKEVFDLVSGASVTVKARKVNSFKAHIYLNGEYFATQTIDPTTIGYNGYIVDGQQSGYYFDGIRISQSATADREDSWCIDNIRASRYKEVDNIDLGLFDSDGNLVQSLVGLEHFMIMVDNSTIAPPPPPAVIVDGVRYEKDADAIAAIKQGSVVELERNMTAAIDINSVLEGLGLDSIKFTLITNGYKTPTVISETHRVVEDSSTTGAYIVTPIGAIVDGVIYEQLADAFAAIKNGSVVELERNLEVAFNVDEILANLGTEKINFKIIPGEFSFAGVISKDHKLVDYTGTFGGYLVTPAGIGEIYGINYKDDLFGVSELATIAAEGTLYPEMIQAGQGAEAAKDGMLWTIVKWSGSYGTNVANGYFAKSDLTITAVAEYSTRIYYYDLTVNGVTEYITESAFGENLAAALAVGDVEVVLWNVVELDSATTLVGTLEIDLNGKDILVSGAETFDVFELLGGAKLNIYSSREGARIDVLGNATLFTAVYDRYKAGSVEITIGNGAAENLTISTAKLIDCHDTYVHDPAIGEDTYNYIGNVTLNIVGLNLTDNGAAEGGAMISTALPTAINVENLNYEGGLTLLAADSDKRATLTASFKDSGFKSNADLVRASGAEKYVSFDACYVGAPLAVIGEEIIEIGAGCSFTVDSETFAESGLTLKASCIVAMADAGDVRCYVDLPENLALITWFDSDGNAIGNSNYNAPFGKIVEVLTEEEAKELVGNLVDNEWYSINFIGWDIPQDFELTKGTFNVYPKWSEPEISVECLKMNLVAYTYFKLNFYLPTENLPEDLELYGIYRECECTSTHNHTREANYKLIDGKWYVLLETGAVTLDGVTYNSYTVYPGAADASEPEYKIAFGVKGELFVDTINCGVPTYAEAVMTEIMEDGAELSEKEKLSAALMMNMVRYANESYKLANNTANGAPKYEALLSAYSEYLIDFDSISFSDAEKNVDVSGIGEYMEGVSFIFGAYQPKFVFKYRDTVLDKLVKPETTDGRIYTWPDGNIGVFTLIYHERYDGNKSLSYLASHLAYNNGAYVEPNIVSGEWGEMTEAYATTIDMSVCDATGVINVAVYTPDGTVVSGSYSLAAYVEYLAKSASEARVKADAAMAAALEAGIKAERAAEEAAKPENAALKDKYEALKLENEKIKAENEAIYAEYEAIYNENSSFMNASLSLYAFSLASQDYARVVEK